MRYASLTRLGAVAGFSAAMVLVVTLAIQKRELENRYEALRDRLMSPQPGLRLPRVRVGTLDGDSLTLGNPPSGEVQVLFFYTTTCPYCRATVPAWNRLAGEVGYGAVLGVQLDSVHKAPAYGDSLGLRYPVAPLDSGLATAVVDWYRVVGVPLTLVVGLDGRVAYSRRGLIEGRSVLDSILAAVRVAIGSSSH